MIFIFRKKGPEKRPKRPSSSEKIPTAVKIGVKEKLPKGAKVTGIIPLPNGEYAVTFDHPQTGRHTLRYVPGRKN